MNEITQHCIASLHLGEPQSHRNIVVFPLISPANGECHWHTLGQAIGSGALTVTEVSHHGSVPNLLVINQGDRPVLLLDGEELIGAKQNRVLNTTILLKERSETVVPVSCTERGRWSYASPKFSEAGTVMAHKVRSRKSRSVSESLSLNAVFSPDQGEVWHGIAELHKSAGTTSATGAMSDVFKAYDQQLAECLAAFPSVPGQTGLIAVVDGAVIGFDLIPHATIYAHEHAKLIKSYVIDALTTREPKAADVMLARTRAEEFLRSTKACTEQQFPSIGYGTDYRFTRPGAAGSALIHDDNVVHAAFFSLSQPAAAEPGMASFQARRQRYTRGTE